MVVRLVLTRESFKFLNSGGVSKMFFVCVFELQHPHQRHTYKEHLRHTSTVGFSQRQEFEGLPSQNQPNYHTTAWYFSLPTSPLSDLHPHQPIDNYHQPKPFLQHQITFYLFFILCNLLYHLHQMSISIHRRNLPTNQQPFWRTQAQCKK